MFGPGERIAVLVEVAEQREAAASIERRGAVVVLAVEAGDVVVDQLRDRGVLADDDEARRNAISCFLPRARRSSRSGRRALRARSAAAAAARADRAPRLAAALLGHLRADVLPEVAEHRHLVAGDVVGDRHARQLDDAALDGVHQREVAHRPGEQRAFGVARAAQEERRRRQVDDARDAELAVDRFEAGNPERARPRCSSRPPSARRLSDLRRLHRPGFSR